MRNVMPNESRTGEKNMRRHLVIWKLFLVSLLLSGCTHMAPAGNDPDMTNEVSIAAKPEVVVASKRYKKEYVLGPSDQLEISMRRLTDRKISLVIRPDGYISLPYIEEELKAGGMTPLELKNKLTDLFSRRFVEPEVSVVVTQTRPPRAFVLGEVRNPTSVEVHTIATAMQAIAQAGGFNEKASKSSVFIVRVRDDGRMVALRVTPELDGPEAAYLALNNVPLEPNDIIYVPKTFISEVSTFFEEHINKIFSGFNTVVSTYTQFRLIELLGK